MGEAAKKPATYADLETVPPHLVAEIIDGELVTSCHLTPRDGIAANLLACEIGSGRRRGSSGSGQWTFIRKPEMRFGSDVLVPDLAGWKNLKALPEHWADMAAPNWACEILSPATEAYDRASKRRIYAAARVEHLWLLDSRPKLMETFSLTENGWMLSDTFCEADLVDSPPFDGVSFCLSHLWPLDNAGGAASRGVN